MERYAADWTQYGNAAGPMRNQAMLELGKPTEAHAYPMKGSRGTWDMIRRLRDAGVPVTIHRMLSATTKN